MTTRKTTAKKAPTAKRGGAKGNVHAKGRSKKRPTFSLKSEGQTLLTTQFDYVAEQAVAVFFDNVRYVSMYDNAKRKTVARWNFGHRIK